jgi:choline kinase
MLAAGIGRRLYGDGDHPPKSLLRFDGKTLLQRHIEILRHLGVAEMVVVVGFQAEMLHAELASIGAQGFVRTIHNADYREGSIVSLWTARAEFDGSAPILFMDGDVLYDHRLMRRLLDSRHPNCFLMDREVETDEEPVKLCMRDGRIVDFHKRPQIEHDYFGEWPGFLRLSPEMARKVGRVVDRYINVGRRADIYEEVFRDLLLSEPPGSFDFEDITGVPWIEIDFPEDLEDAKSKVFPRLCNT